MGRFEGKVIVITGATSGLGRHAAVAFAAEGARVVAAGRREDAGAETLKRMREAGGDGIFVATDVSKSDSVKALMAAAVDNYGRIDLAYNNAGVSGTAWHKAVDYEEDAWDEVMAINLRGMYLCMRYEIEAMMHNDGPERGAIVNMASVAGVSGTPGGIGYVASKHGVVGLTRAAALDHGVDGIRINGVAPGVIYTEMLDEGIKERPGLETEMLAKHPVGRLGQMDEVTEAAMWLLSPQASFLLGEIINVDGGYVIG